MINLHEFVMENGAHVVAAAVHLVALEAIGLRARAHAAAWCHHRGHAADSCLLLGSLVGYVNYCEDLLDVEDLAEVVFCVLDVARGVDDLLLDGALLLHELGGLATSSVLTDQGLVLLLAATPGREDVLWLGLVLVISSKDTAVNEVGIFMHIIKLPSTKSYHQFVSLATEHASH